MLTKVGYFFMEKLYDKLSVYFSGEIKIDNTIKYSAICCGLSAIHGCFSVAFFILSMLPLGIYNAFITLVYLSFATYFIPSQKFKFMYYFTIIEIVFHSMVVSILAGYNYGFMIYTIALVPVSFYFSVTFPDYKHKLIRPFLCDTIVFVCFCSTKIVCGLNAPIYDQFSTKFVTDYLYCFNSMIAFVMLTIFTVLFTLEIKHYQKDLRNQNAKLNILANEDPLTSLLNRRSMESHFEAAVRNAKDNNQPFCIIMGDIDHFKQTNDSYGHDCGDDVLKYVSKTIIQNLDSRDVVCRWGGEEFLILIHKNLKDTFAIVDKLRQQICSQQVKSNTVMIDVTITFGIAEFDKEHSIADTIIQADSKMYKGKENGRNQVVY